MESEGLALLFMANYQILIPLMSGLGFLIVFTHIYYNFFYHDYSYYALPFKLDIFMRMDYTLFLVGSFLLSLLALLRVIGIRQQM